MNIPTLSLRRQKLSISKTRNAFSLIELLVVIAIIGIIAAIAIPNIGGLTAGATKAKDQRNAQNLASVFSSARASGNVDSFADKAAAVTALVTTGLTAPNGATFSVPNLSAGEQTGALNYLDTTGALTTLQLTYNANAVVP